MNKILKKKKELVLVRKIKKISDIPEYLSFLLKSYDFEDNILDLYYLVEDDGNYIYSETNDYSFSRKDILLTVFGGKIFESK